MGEISNKYKYVSATGAFFAWGSWAFWVNYLPDIKHGYISGLIQGSASFMITLLMVELVRYIANRVPPPCKLLVPPALTVLMTGSALYSVHWLVKTPNISATIAAPLSVAFCFCLFTSYKIIKMHTDNSRD